MISSGDSAAGNVRSYRRAISWAEPVQHGRQRGRARAGADEVGEHEVVGMFIAKIADEAGQGGRFAQAAFAGEQKRRFAVGQCEISQLGIEVVAADVEPGAKFEEPLVEVGLGVEWRRTAAGSVGEIQLGLDLVQSQVSTSLPKASSRRACRGCD